MGFGIPQEIFKETYQRLLIVNKVTQAKTKAVASWAYIHWGCPDFMGANLLPLAESESHYCGMPKPITHAGLINQGLCKGLIERPRHRQAGADM